MTSPVPDDASPRATSSARLVAEARARVRELSPAELAAWRDRGALVVDVREAGELGARGVIAGAVHVPRGLLEFAADPESGGHHPGFDPARPVVLYCAVGGRSALAAATLRAMGYADVAHLAGGIGAWLAAGLPTDAPPAPDAAG